MQLPALSRPLTSADRQEASLVPWLRAPERPLVDPEAGIGLRPWAAVDAPALAAAWADPEVAAHTGVPAIPGRARADRWIAGWEDRSVSGRAVDLVIHPLDEPDDVWGEVGLWPLAGSGPDRHRRAIELGWWVRSDRRGIGVATAAVARAAGWAATELPVEAVVARIRPGHLRSEAVAERIGFTRRGRLDATHDLWAGPIAQKGPPAGRWKGQASWRR